MIELLIEQLHATGENEGIWFFYDKEKDKKLIELLKKYDPNNKYIKDILKYSKV